MEPAHTRAGLTTRAFRLEFLTIGWNIVEAVVAVAAGIAASSIALIGFGLDSLIEVFAASVVVWQLRGVSEEREHRALRLIALSFFTPYFERLTWGFAPRPSHRTRHMWDRALAKVARSRTCTSPPQLQLDEPIGSIIGFDFDLFPHFGIVCPCDLVDYGSRL